MQKHTSRPFECNGPRKQQHRNPATDNVPPGDGLVLADALARDRFRDGDCAVMCPGCGDVIERFYQGLPKPFIRLPNSCRSCGVTSRPWSVVVVPSVDSVVPTDVFSERVQDYWDRQFRIGASDPSLPYTREFTKITQQLADEWNWEWEVSCPLCNRPVADLRRAYLGYHHWWYQPDIGTSLCECCHDYIHGVDSSVDEKRRHQALAQNWRAKKLGLRDMRDLAVIRLALRDRQVHDHDLAEDDPEYSQRLQRRYNVPLELQRISRLVSDIRYHDPVAEVIETSGGTADIASQGYPVCNELDFDP